MTWSRPTLLIHIRALNRLVTDTFPIPLEDHLRLEYYEEILFRVAKLYTAIQPEYLKLKEELMEKGMLEP